MRFACEAHATVMVTIGTRAGHGRVWTLMTVKSRWSGSWYYSEKAAGKKKINIWENGWNYTLIAALYVDDPRFTCKTRIYTVWRPSSWALLNQDFAWYLIFAKGDVPNCRVLRLLEMLMFLEINFKFNRETSKTKLTVSSGEPRIFFKGRAGTEIFI